MPEQIRYTNKYLTLVFITVFGLYSTFSLADCEVNNDNGSTNGISNQRTGQSFIPCESGLLTSINVWVVVTSNSTSLTGDFYIAENPANGLVISGSPTQQLNIPISGNSSRESILIELDTPVFVTAGLSYRFELENLTEFLSAALANTYLDGNGYNNGFISGGSDDIDFIVNIVSPPPPDPVPTLDVFAKLLMLTIILLIGIYWFKNPGINNESE